MQEILPGLWLGPYVCSKNRELLRTRGITHILCLRDATEKFIVKCHFPQEIQYHEMWVDRHDLTVGNLEGIWGTERVFRSSWSGLLLSLDLNSQTSIRQTQRSLGSPSREPDTTFPICKEVYRQRASCRRPCFCPLQRRHFSSAGVCRCLCHGDSSMGFSNVFQLCAK